MSIPCCSLRNRSCGLSLIYMGLGAEKSHSAINTTFQRHYFLPRKYRDQPAVIIATTRHNLSFVLQTQAPQTFEQLILEFVATSRKHISEALLEPSQNSYCYRIGYLTHRGTQDPMVIRTTWVFLIAINNNKIPILARQSFVSMM